MTRVLFFFLLLGVMPIMPTLAGDKAGQAADFRPYKLVGDWQFVSSVTGRHYGGDIEVTITSIDGNGTMRGQISYDGRQTNDQCSTKRLFIDKPAEAEIIKTANDYRVTFQVDCLHGVSPRIISWTLTCKEGACSMPDVLPWGQGAKVLRESR